MRNKRKLKNYLTRGTILLVWLLSTVIAQAQQPVKEVRKNFAAKNIAVSELIKRLGVEYPYSFFIADKEAAEVKVSVEAKDATAEQVLTQAFIGKDLSFVRKDKSITISLKAKQQQVQQQQRTDKPITGKVLDATGEPLVGASIREKGTENGNISDANGNFTLNLPPNAVLQISYIGYVTQEIPVGSQTTFNITLQEDATALDEVVVVGYGTQKKVNLTGSVASVKGNELVKSPVASTVNTLAGRLPGLVIKQTNGAPGMDQASINIRNFGSALILVDGSEQSFNNIDPNEIESISILKDASAAIYGARAGNGVILVQTKRGASGKPVISINSSYTGQAYTNFPEQVNAGQYATLYRETQINSGVAEKNLRYSEEDIAKYFAGTDPAYPNTNWLDFCLKNWAPQHQHNISIAGGTDAVRYYTFFSYLDQGGIWKVAEGHKENTYYDRFNVRSNLDISITSQLTASFDLSAIKETVSQTPRPGGDNNEWAWMDLFNSFPTYPSSFPDKSKVPQTGMGDFNPILNPDENLIGYNRNKKTSINGSITLDYKIKPITGLGAKVKFNYYQLMQDKKVWLKQVETYRWNQASDTYSLVFRWNPSSLDNYYYSNQTITGQASLYYDRIFDNKHTVNALLLFEAMDYYNKSLQGSRINYVTSAIDELFAGSTVDQTATGSANQSSRESLVGRVHYDYLGKYLLEATFRYDGSPNFPKDKRWGFFPSISAGWRLSEESFMKTPWLDNLKIRGGYSKTGYDGVGAYQYLAGFVFSGLYVVDGTETSTLTTTGIPNPNITWETMTLTNIGLDFSVFKGKLYGEADVFQRLRDGMLATRTAALPNTFGASLPSENINSQVAKGYELLLGTRGKIGDFKYDISGNISYSRAKWKHYEQVEYTDPDEIRRYQLSGKYIDQGWGLVSDGLFTSQEEIDNLGYNMDNQNNKTLNPGDIKYLDLNNDGVINWKDERVINNGGTPHTMYGLNLLLGYKGFDFSLLVQGAGNFSVTLLGANICIDSDRPAYKVVWDERWTPENNNKNAIIPRQRFSQYTNVWTSDYWVKDVTYLRLKNLDLGYNFPTKLVKPIGISNLRLYVSGTNLMTLCGITKYGFDPESPTSNRGWSYPIMKTVTAGLNVKF
ncbi:MAG: TonB-dependent receptor [Tannerella sp.]|jgi:TonB-linked SusC/RagA family outer membrane protein|nr:TonB-dependent receptor [Tannerella sp.]